MKDIKNILKNNKFSVVAIIILAIIVVLLVQIKLIFFPSEGKAIYGDRLKDIKKYEITTKNINEINSKLKDDSAVKKSSTRISGRTIEINIVVNDDFSKDTAKSLADKSIETLSDRQKGYYDIQVFISKTSTDAADFPIIGYKHHSKDKFTFTKDR